MSDKKEPSARAQGEQSESRSESERGWGPRERQEKSRVVAARMKLRERFFAKIQGTPARSDPRPLGSGPANRHGMPQLPAGQVETKQWPVLDLGAQPQVSIEKWQLKLEGAVQNSLTLRWEDFLALEQVEDVSDFHCVTTWSKFGMLWRGVRFSTIAALAEPTEEARFVVAGAYDGYTTNVPLEEALKDDVLLVHTYDGMPLPREHGGPVRMITPQLYAWKGAKWINRIAFLTEDEPGFWEVRGYSNTAHPWRNDRYS